MMSNRQQTFPTTAMTLPPDHRTLIFHVKMSLLKYCALPRLFELLGSLSELPKPDCLFITKPHLRCHHNLYLGMSGYMCVYLFSLLNCNPLAGTDYNLFLSMLLEICHLPPEPKWVYQVWLSVDTGHLLLPPIWSFWKLLCTSAYGE